MQTVTLAIAVLGAVLGLYNAWRNWIQDRVRVRVKVGFAFSQDGTGGLSINVVNLSAFAITLTHFGFEFLQETNHAQILFPIFSCGETLPVRLESRTSCTVFQPLSALPSDRWWKVDQCYVSTACDLKLVGGRRFFNKNRATIASQS